MAGRLKKLPQKWNNPDNPAGKMRQKEKIKKWKFKLKEKSAGTLKEEHIKYFFQTVA
jgi:hypothetical protein